MWSMVPDVKATAVPGCVTEGRAPVPETQACVVMGASQDGQEMIVLRVVCDVKMLKVDIAHEVCDVTLATVSTPQSNDSNGATIGGIVGGVLAVVVVVLAVIGVMFYRRKNNASNINKEHSIYEDISAMEPDRHQVQTSQGVNRDKGEEMEEMEEMEEEADRNSYYNIKAPVIVTEVAVDKLGDGIRELQATEGGFEQEFKVEPHFIFQYPRTHGINIKSGYQVACHNTTA
ncbi:uncharacterized protein LOC125382008 [Haliotis rufescens]|uniref:uncharacterized protein LOC125382008 n=1 Tax=Haliotis rufescens TaxID=6454 RepID=UPI00201F2E59|nr:uncharacterized protein LOC125382008 [Haliotis rufescens]